LRGDGAGEAELGDLPGEALRLLLGCALVEVVGPKVAPGVPLRSICQAAVRMEAATAQIAFFGPRRWRSRWNCARR
jgi:hypothetical protein